MSELKAFVARKIDYGTCEPVPCIEVYPKSEADKVIAELEKKRDCTIEHAAEVIKAQERELRHHKYKRCLAMAKWCEMGISYWDDDEQEGGWEYKKIAALYSLEKALA